MKFILPRFLINIERWKWNSEYRVYVSNTGRFKDEYKKELPIKISNIGYTMIKTYTGIKLAHRLVMITWRPTRDMENLTVDHLDSNKRNNVLSNLEWVTKEENQRRAIATLVKKEPTTNKQKEAHPDYKLVFNAKQKVKFNTYEEAAIWLIKNRICKNDRENVKIENIINRIRNAVNNQKSYYTYKWKWVKINE